MTRLILAGTAVLLLGSVNQVRANTITYTLSSTVSGTLGGSSFTDALVTLTLIGDTANVMPGPVPFTDVVVNTGSATVDVAGIGTATFTDTVDIVDTLTDPVLGEPVVLFLDNTTGTGIMLQTGSVFTTYDLRSSLGPLAGTGGVASGSQVTPVFATTAGDLTWTVGQSLGTSTFTAAVITPEPSTLAFLGVALLALVWRSRFKRLA